MHWAIHVHEFHVARVLCIVFVLSLYYSHLLRSVLPVRSGGQFHEYAAHTVQHHEAARHPERQEAPVALQASLAQRYAQEDCHG